MFRAGGARDAKCLEVHGTVPNNEEWRHQLPAAPLLRNSEAPFTRWNKPFQNVPSGYMFFVCNFLKCSHLQTTFCLHLFFFPLLWPFLLDIFLLFLRSAVHPLSPMHILSQGLPSDVPLDSFKSDTHRRL